MKQFGLIGNEHVKFICLKCGEKEEISMDVVKFLDGSDLMFEPEAPPQFSCKRCEGEMYPEYYKNDLGVEFRISDVQ